MSYTNVPCDIFENEIEILPSNTSNEYQLLSNNFLNCDIDSDDASSIVSRSASRTNKVNFKSIKNLVNSSGTNAEKVIISESKDVIIGTVYERPVLIDYFVVGRNDLKDNFNLQFSDKPDPLKTTTKQSKASYRNRIYSFRSEPQLIVFIVGSVVLLTTIITAGYYLHLLGKEFGKKTKKFYL